MRDGSATEGRNFALFREEVLEARNERLHGDVLLTIPSRLRNLVLLLVLLVGSAISWLCVGEYARTEVARGVLVTNRGSAKILVPRQGVVTEVLVGDGDRVSVGQRLAIVHVELPTEAGASPIGDSLQALDSQARLLQRQAQLATERARSDRQQQIATLDGLERQRADLVAQIDLQKELVDSSSNTLERIQSVVDRGYVSRLELERRRQAWIGARQQLSQLRQQLSANLAEQARSRAQLGRIDAQGGTEVAAAAISTQALAQQRAQLQGERAFVVQAPIAGRVTALRASPGKATEPGVPLMMILPEGSGLHAEIYAPSRAIGFVRPGQRVRLMYDAFPYQRFGSHSGQIRGVSRTVLSPSELSAPIKVEEPVYQIDATPASQHVVAFGERLPLQPGMTLTAQIVLDRRSFLDWLLEPFEVVLARRDAQ